ncbi:carbohydrate esterase family 16 protein [Stachybotrys elegans]|uniref:Carbohydrate esterase family 16 protein n=1 Tax=Stachybotrys elegans TaxID=80388 RepID=A0A8K0WS78_9HYPO|nr:carbohydrate esterase family 16 protein [Stachybotrys elegans]
MRQSLVYAGLAGAAAISAQATPNYLISFGDSYSQTGFEIDGAKPSAANPLGNPPLPGWTASGGLDWVGFMVTEFNSSLTLSYNFAYGGAVVDGDIIPPYADHVRTLIDQVGIFSNSLASKPCYAPWTSDNALFAVWMGVNDVGNSWWMDGQQERLTSIIDAYFEQVQILYDAGARNFAILTVPPTDRSPMFLNSNPPENLAILRNVIDQFNGIVTDYIGEFTAANDDATFRVIDTTLGFNEALDNPQEYGSPDATCFNGDGVSCLWFNDYHPGIEIQRLVGSQVAAAWPEFFDCTDSVMC